MISVKDFFSSIRRKPRTNESLAVLMKHSLGLPDIAMKAKQVRRTAKKLYVYFAQLV